MKILKSILYTPALIKKGYLKTSQVGADANVFDLEDSIPKLQKSIARKIMVEEYLNQKNNFCTGVRVNGIRTVDGFEDMLALLKSKYMPEFIVMTMVDDAVEVEIARSVLMARADVPKIFITVETPKCIFNIEKIASVCDGLIFGSADYAAFLGCDITWGNMLYARQRIVLAASCAQIPAVDTACYSLKNFDELITECRKIKELGFVGKVAVHPDQVPYINKIMSPTEEEIQQASLIVKQFEENQEKISTVDGSMIGPPFIKKAKKILESVLSE